LGNFRLPPISAERLPSGRSFGAGEVGSARRIIGPETGAAKSTVRSLRRVAGLAVSASILFCANAQARGDGAGMNDSLKDPFKGPFSGVYEVRGEGFVHNVGDIWVNVTNLGVVGNPWKTVSTDPSCQYPPGSGVEYLWGAGLWVGAKIGENAEPRVSTALLDWEFRPSTLPLDTIYESYEGFPGGMRFFNDDGDVDFVGREIVDEEVHDGRDNDRDGLIDEDFGAISQQMFTCVYRDDTPQALNTYPDHVPMGLEVTQRSFAWGIPGSDDFVGIEYTIKNDGARNLRDVYLGFFCDADVGPESDELYWLDDRAGLVEIDTTVGGGGEGGCEVKPQRLRLMVGETHDNDGDQGRARGWLGTVLMGHTTDLRGRKAPPKVAVTSFRFVSGGAAYERCGNPRNDLQRYDLLSSNMIGCPPGRLSAVEDADYKMFFGTGPFKELKRGKTLTLRVAFVIGEGRQELKENAVAAQRIYNGEYRDLDNDPFTGVRGKETCLKLEPGEVSWRFDPVSHCDLPDEYRMNPEYAPVLISAGSCVENPRQWVDYDCDPCTGIEGRESLVRWRGATAPPCPRVETDFPPEEEYPCHTLSFSEETGAATRERIRGPAVQLLSHDEAVTIRWNNASELVTDPLSGRYDFAGYRIWRAEQWDRPVGSTGPSPELWILLAEYRLPRYLEPGKGQMDLTTARAQEEMAPCDTVDAGKDRYLYPVGYYRHRDDHVLNGFTYFYSVTAFDLNDTGEIEPRTGKKKKSMLECRRTAAEDQAVVPESDPSEDAGEVFVVPNPYYGSTAWDLTPNPKDPTGTHVDFMNMPKGPWTVRIYTMAGDLVRTLENDTGRDVGQVRWDLVSRNGQDVATGIYIYSVQSRYGSQVGKIAVLQERTYTR